LGANAKLAAEDVSIAAALDCIRDDVNWLELCLFRDHVIVEVSECGEVGGTKWRVALR